MLCAFEPVKYCMAAPRLSAGDEAEVGLKPARDQDARLRLALPEHALDEPVVDEASISDGSAPAARMSMIAARLAAAPEAADRRRSGRRAPLAEIRDQRRGVVRVGQRCRPAWRFRSSMALRMSASFFAPMPLQRADPAVVCRALELVERPHAELAVERRDGLRPTP